MAKKQDSLAIYRHKRDFTTTTEPDGEVATGEGWSFVVHKHAASHLHFDLRLELDGVLKCWAVPKGPSYDPADRRLAVQVEDHPLDYGGFEGVIPAGEYGGGTVMLWDRGTWTPEGDPRQGLARGKMVFTLQGEKLRGAWHLARMGGKAAGREGKPNWLLIKGKDDEAQTGRDPDGDEARSVLSGRTMAAIARARDRTWSGASGETTVSAADLPGARKAPFPREPSPQLATLANEVPSGEGWVHEIKFDGYRLLAHVKNHKVKLMTRGGKDWTRKFPGLARALAELPHDAVIDGEATVVDEAGRTDFQALQSTLEAAGKHGIVYFAFDLLHLAGYDLTRVPLWRRKEALAALLAGAAMTTGPVRLSEHLDGQGEAVHAHACRLGLEGIIAKRADAPYVQRRTRSWLKIKCGKRQEFVIGGYLASEKRKGLRSLLLGVYRDDELIYVGKVGTGFDHATLVDLARKLDRIAVKQSPFVDDGAIREKGIHWASPQLVCEVEFTEWTASGHLRHPSFKGLRKDKKPRNVVRENPVPAAPTVAASPPGITHPDRVLFPEAGITKGQLAAYYEAIADRLLPHVAGRPLTLVRCPAGRHKECFYQKHHTGNLPASIHAVKVPEKQKSAQYVTIDDRQGLLALIQMGALELHPWGSRNDALERPDRMFFDLDPGPGVSLDDVAAAALQIRDRLADLGLTSFVKTSGGKGYHVIAPIVRRVDWDQLKSFTRALADDLARTEPRRYVSVMTKAKRQGKIFIDYLRNGRGATSVATFSTRARAGAPVSVPVSWQEVRKAIAPDAFTIENLSARLQRQRKDPWAEYFTVKQYLTVAMMKEVMRRDQGA